MKTVRNHIIGAGIALAIAGVALAPLALPAQEKGSARGGARLLLPPKPIKTPEDLSTLQPGDTIVMACPKCENVTVTYVEPTFKPAESREKTKVLHTCPGCGTTTTVEGHGKARKNVIKHVCKNCGSKNAFCCVTRAGGAATPGMAPPVEKAPSEPGVEALVCPDCKVAVQVVPPRYPNDNAGSAAKVRRHDCPGCQGRLATFFKEGKWQHSCTICANSPYTCKLTHPVTEAGDE